MSWSQRPGHAVRGGVPGGHVLVSETPGHVVRGGVSGGHVLVSETWTCLARGGVPGGHVLVSETWTCLARTRARCSRARRVAGQAPSPYSRSHCSSTISDHTSSETSRRPPRRV